MLDYEVVLDMCLLVIQNESVILANQFSKTQWFGTLTVTSADSPKSTGGISMFHIHRIFPNQ